MYMPLVCFKASSPVGAIYEQQQSQQVQPMQDESAHTDESGISAGCAAERAARRPHETKARGARATRAAARVVRRPRETRDESAGRIGNESDGATRGARARRNCAVHERQERQREPGHRVAEQRSYGADARGQRD